MDEVMSEMAMDNIAINNMANNEIARNEIAKNDMAMNEMAMNGSLGQAATAVTEGSVSYLGSALNIQLPKFEGPLALLLYLIRKDEMDIFDIKIHEITKQYLEYIKLMKEFDIDVAGDFIAMASTLLQIKSRMLLPNYNEQGEVIESEDPRKELVQKLLEYQKYQEAAKLLTDRPWLGRDVWPRGYREKMDAVEDEVVLEENALFSLISAYRTAMKGVKKRVHKVAAKLQSIASRVMEIKEFLIVGLRVPTSAMITDLNRRRAQTLITFLSVLELAKMGFVRLFQADTYGELYVEATKPIETDAISRVEEYDSHNAEAVASSMLTKAVEAQILEHEQEVVVDLDGSGQGAASDTELDEFAKKMEKSDLIEAGLLDLGSSLDNGSEISFEDMASDEDILAAEKEIEDHATVFPVENKLEYVIDNSKDYAAEFSDEYSDEYVAENKSQDNFNNFSEPNDNLDNNGESNV